MNKNNKMFLMFCLVLSAALCNAHNVAGTTEKKGYDITIEVIIKSCHGGLDKSASIHASINGHSLVVVFSDDLGLVSVEVATTDGASAQCLSVLTPNGLQFYIPNAGDYIVTFALPNGDEYYGEFMVTD